MSKHLCSSSELLLDSIRQLSAICAEESRAPNNQISQTRKSSIQNYVMCRDRFLLAVGITMKGVSAPDLTRLKKTFFMPTVSRNVTLAYTKSVDELVRWCQSRGLPIDDSRWMPESYEQKMRTEEKIAEAAAQFHVLKSWYDALHT